MSVTITVIDEATPLLTRLTGAPYDAALALISFTVGEEARNEAQVYPGPAHSPVIWSSARQRRAYFAKRRAAGAPAKYTRKTDPMSQRLQQSWVVERRGRVGAATKTDVAYAAYVQSAESQSPQHAATGWQTDEKIVANVVASGAVERIAVQVLGQLIGG